MGIALRVLRIQEPVPFWPLYQGFGMSNPDHISKSLESICGLKYLNSLMRIRDGQNSDLGWKNLDPGSVMKKIRIRTPAFWGICWLCCSCCCCCRAPAPGGGEEDAERVRGRVHRVTCHEEEVRRGHRRHRYLLVLQGYHSLSKVRVLILRRHRYLLVLHSHNSQPRKGTGIDLVSSQVPISPAWSPQPLNGSGIDIASFCMVTGIFILPCRLLKFTISIKVLGFPEIRS